ncbi:hypothetical protein EDD85DRAFT_126596 [Armillaria nabsnona]|nr:hypothetical protein EDD85DRAFT_126596 [Armillaria nabsnona]
MSISGQTRIFHSSRPLCRIKEKTNRSLCCLSHASHCSLFPLCLRVPLSPPYKNPCHPIDRSKLSSQFFYTCFFILPLYLPAMRFSLVALPLSTPASSPAARSAARPVLASTTVTATPQTTPVFARMPTLSTASSLASPVLAQAMTLRPRSPSPRPCALPRASH